MTFADACRTGNLKLVYQSIINDADDFDWRLGFKNACFGGHRKIVDLLILKGANDWNKGLKFACFGGSPEHLEIIKMLIAKGANDWNNGLRCACLQVHHDVIVLMLMKGATKYKYLYENQIDLQLLVEQYHLPLNRLQSISMDMYTQLRDKYKCIKFVMLCLISVSDLNGIVVKYLVK